MCSNLEESFKRPWTSTPIPQLDYNAARGDTLTCIILEPEKKPSIIYTTLVTLYSFFIKFFTFLASLTFLHYFWIINLFLWVGLESAIIFTSFFNKKHSFQKDGFVRFLTTMYSKLCFIYPLKRSYVRFLVVSWL